MRDPGSQALSLGADSPAATAKIAATLAARVGPGDCIAMDGSLGAGKTLFAAALCEALGLPAGEVDSPSFVLLNEYAGAALPLFHFDAYRLEGGEAELIDAGFFDERLVEGLCIVEWAERLAPWLPADALRLVIEVTGEQTRRLHFSGWPPERLAAFAGALETT